MYTGKFTASEEERSKAAVKICEAISPAGIQEDKKGLRKAQKLERPVLPSIEDRPIKADLREEIGHWEDDCVVSRQSKVRIKTINEKGWTGSD